MTEPTEPIPNIIINTRKHHLTCIKKDIDSEYSQQLWYIVSGAIECGGLGGSSWGWRAHPLHTFKEYNSAKSEDYTESYPHVGMQFMNYEDDEALSDFIWVNASWLHNKVVKFVNDPKMPNHLRAHYAELLVTRELPNDSDAVTCDALMQYAFSNEIIFG